MNTKWCGHFREVIIYCNYNPESKFSILNCLFYLSAPTPGSLVERTSTYIKLAFSKVPEDVGQLTYKVEGSLGGTHSCSVALETCEIFGLSPGRRYNLSMVACITVDQTRCGEASQPLTVSTLPNGNLFFQILNLKSEGNTLCKVHSHPK